MEMNEEEARLVEEIRTRVQMLQRMGRNDLLLRAIGVPALEELRIEAARGNLKNALKALLAEIEEAE